MRQALLKWTDEKFDVSPFLKTPAKPFPYLTCEVMDYGGHESRGASPRSRLRSGL
jgi:hypothetical protein